MPCIYVIQSLTTNKLYVGSSRDANPSVRVATHNAARVSSTKSGRPWQLIHTEMYNTYTEARKRELFLKTGKGRTLLKQILS
jgi:putative endonuclease